MIKLSFSKINNCLQENNSHNWINSVCGAKPEDKWYYHEGTEAHRIIQEHVSGKTPHPLLSHITQKFDIVEERDFDPKCKFKFDLREMLTAYCMDMLGDEKFLMEDEYEIRGFHDGKDMKLTKFLEIKTSVTPWSVGKFQKSFQRKLYALPYPSITKSYLITGKRKEEEWEEHKPKIYVVPVVVQDRVDAVKWILEAVKRLEAGDLRGGLNEDGICTDTWCYYGVNCNFR